MILCRLVHRLRLATYVAEALSLKYVYSGNGLLLLALRRPMSLPVSTTLQLHDRCWSGFIVSGGI